jgi:protein gp37
MTRTSIEWVRNRDGSQGFTVNPIRFQNKETGKVGHYCEKVSPGCKNCYASRMQKGPYLSGLEFIAENKDKGELFFDESVLHQVLRRQKPSTFFWCDCTDLFGPWVPDEWRDRIAAVCALTHQHRHLWLTKRAKRMREYWANHHARLHRIFTAAAGMGKLAGSLVWKSFSEGIVRPLPNLGLGVSAEDQERYDERYPELEKTPADMRFLSLEPMLSDITMRFVHFGKSHGKPDCVACPRCHGTMSEPVPGGGKTCRVCFDSPGGQGYFGLPNWVIVGGESGPGARPMHPDWARSVRDQCQAAGVPFFFKQWGEWAPECETFHKVSDHRYSHETFAWNRDGTPYNALNPAVGSFPSQMMYRVGKRAAGRLLDGRTWDEMQEMLK